MFVSVGDEGIIWESAEFVLIYAAVPWRRSGNVGMMMALGAFDVRDVGVIGDLFENSARVKAIYFVICLDFTAGSYVIEDRTI